MSSSPSADLMTPPAEVGGTSVRWYSLYVKPKLTKDIAESLREKGYDAFTPISVITRQWRDRIGKIEAPHFPGYVFARLDLRGRMPVLLTPGVHGLVGIGKQPIAIEEDEIANVRRLITSGLPLESWAFLRRGERVTIERGPLAGVSGVFLEMKKSYRLIVSVELIGRSIAVEVDPGSVRAIPGGTA